MFEHSIKNLYVWDVTWWKPWGNTLAYFPLDNDTSDHSGNWKTLTNTWTKTTIWYNFTDTSMVSWWLPDVAFFSAWVKNNSASGNYSCMTPSLEKYTCWYFNYNSVYGNKFFCVIWSRTRLDWPTNPSQWHNICIGYDWTKMVYWIDGVMQTLVNWKWDYVNNDTYLFRKDSGVSASINISEAIFESVCWTSEEYAEYFTQTKSKYWL